MDRRFMGQILSLLSVFSLVTLGAGRTAAQTANSAVINNERVNIRSGPGEQFSRFTLLDKETRVTEISRQNGWSQIRLSDGKTGWLHDRYLRYLNPQKAAQAVANPAQQPAKTALQAKQEADAKRLADAKRVAEAKRQAEAKRLAEAKRDAEAKRLADAKREAEAKRQAEANRLAEDQRKAEAKRLADAKREAEKNSAASREASKPAVQAPTNSSGSNTAAAAATATPASSKPAAKPNDPTTQRPNDPTTQPPNDPSSIAGLLVDTKKDPFAGGSGVGVGMGDAFRLLLYLLPVLGLIVLAVRGLKKFQEKTGSLPSFKGSILGGFNLSKSRTIGGSNIRVVESVPVGGMELHVVEVRGRMLLLSSSGQSVTLLTELKDGEEGQSDFQTLLGSLTGEDDYEEDLDSTIGVTVGSLDDSLRETREAIVRSAKRTLNDRASGASEDEGNLDDQLFGRKKTAGRR